MSELIASRIWPDAAIETSIFGTADPNEIWAYVRELVPEAVGCFAFRVSVGALLGLELRDGMRVAVKVHRGLSETFLDGVQRVQEHLWRGKFPCPRPLGRRGPATLEEWRDEGAFRDAHEPMVRKAMARTLAELISLTRELGPVEGMELNFGRVPEGALWPVPHNVLFDFEATAAGAEWIDEIARAAKAIRDTPVGPALVGHADWSVKHFRFDEDFRPTVVYDWDSLNVDREPLFAGQAAATFTYTEELRVQLWPTVDEAKVFLDDYDDARAEPFSDEELRVAHAAAVYIRAYAARCGHAVGADTRREPLREYAEALL